MKENLDKTLSRLMDGLLTPAEEAQLEQRLLQDPEARELYRLHVAVHRELADQPRESSPVIEISRWRKWRLSAAAAAVLICAAIVMLWNHRAPQQSLATQGNASTQVLPPVIAVAVQVDHGKWTRDTPLIPGTRLQAGKYELTDGTVILDLIGGQRLTLKAPLQMELLNDREMKLHSGDAGLRVLKHNANYVIHVPGGAVVDLGTEIALKVDQAGHSDVRVFEGRANASVVGAGGRTRQERMLRAGDVIRISDRLQNSEMTGDSFLRTPAGSAMDRSPASDPYAAQVKQSQPLAWWRFEQMYNPMAVAPETGENALILYENPQIHGPSGRRFLQTNEEQANGFAMPMTPILGLDTAAGFSLEMLIYPQSENYGTALAIDQPGGDDSYELRKSKQVRHEPQRLLIERAGLCGSRIGHVHPDYALRALMRSPAGYEGGVNTYSAESHLIGRWVHVAFTFDGKFLKLYIDGVLSDQTETDQPVQGAALRPIIGRMHSSPFGEKRQWNGGIDEVALYDRALRAEEISAHVNALSP
jgi:ferric-dicitrate binding protein FerR (iron transport regulator)